MSEPPTSRHVPASRPPSGWSGWHDLDPRLREILLLAASVSIGIGAGLVMTGSWGASAPEPSLPPILASPPSASEEEGEPSEDVEAEGPEERPEEEGLLDGEIPDWVFDDASGGDPPAGRRYSVLGDGGTGEPERTARRGAPGGPSSEPGQGDETPIPTNVSGVLAYRSSRDRFAFHDVGHLQGEGALRIGTEWSVPGACRSAVLVDRRGQGEELARGREQSPTGDWLMSVVVPHEDCLRASRRFLPRASPEDAEQDALAGAAASSSVVSALGASSFAPRDLVEVARRSSEKGEKLWGVFRERIQTTRVSPPPPRSQLAFVAEQRDGQWEILWARYSDDSRETLTLVGVVNDTEGASEAFFGVRAQGGRDRVLEVGPVGDGEEGWELVETHEL